MAPAACCMGFAVVAPGRIVQGTVHEDVVGGSAGDRIDGESDGARQLAVALEARGKPGIHAEVLRQPGGRHGADAVLDGVVAGGGKQGTRREAVDLVGAQAGVGDGLLGCLQGEDAQRAVRVLHHVSVRVADDCDRDCAPGTVSSCEREGRHGDVRSKILECDAHPAAEGQGSVLAHRAGGR